MSAAENYVAAAYLVVFVAVLAYVLIIAAKIGRLDREVSELTELARARRPRTGRDGVPEREEAPVG